MSQQISARRSDLFVGATGAIAGAVTALAVVAQDGAGASLLMLAVRSLVAAQGGAALGWLSRAALRWIVRRRFGDAVAAAYERRDAAPYAVFLLTLTSVVGVQLVAPVFALILALFVLLQWSAVRRSVRAGQADGVRGLGSLGVLSPLFFLSGAAALIYQVAWQRTLYNHFGVNMESVTIIVAIFMFGLGLGALAGGRLSRLAPPVLPWLFVGVESAIGLFGVFSLPLLARVGAMAEQRSLPVIAAAVFGVLAIPTLLMGATLPVLVAYVHRESRDVGAAVARLYFVNTLGSAFACFFTVDVLFAFVGLRASTFVAAACNAAVALLCLVYVARREA
ncbi:MAG: hypothetical protein HYR75_08030 [Gemmatimonadetes bacterium]|nr:hypothetical protein [Gemmatimonadota bacterium]MBI3504625.1 hypothetical protein [Pseudomonadota bacterium]